MLFEEVVLKLAVEENILHSRSTLIDYYKLFFQGTFGPGHFISNEENARNFLIEELASAQNYESHLFQKINYRQNFYRVNLAVLNQKLVSLEDFFNGFIFSSRFDINIPIAQWLNEWHHIESILKKSSLKIPDFEEASYWLRQQFNQEKHVISHSETYRNFYHPHYRLFTEIEFKKLALNKK